jgi:uncharacterized repeat protein (TIGR03833 family)
MDSNGTNKSDLSEGLEVIINPQSDRTRKERVPGCIAEILTKTETHSHGILVRLDNGTVGRVKGVSDETPKSPVVDNMANSLIQTEAGLAEIIAKGENHFAEFKSSALWSENLSPQKIQASNSGDLKQHGRNTSKIIIAKTIAGFLNTDGGALVIGVKENKDSNEDEIIGIESEFGKLKDPCADGYRRKLIDAVIKPYFPSSIFNHFNNYLQIIFEEVNEQLVCYIKIAKSDQKVFLNISSKEYFFIRVDASTRQLIGEEIVDFCVRRFG